MLGELLLKIRMKKNISKTQLARETNINIGHITHIEKGERTPSHKALRKICETLDVPYQQIMYTYDKELSNEQKESDFIDYIPYNSVLAINSIDDLIFCPTKYGNASISLKINDTSMEPTLLKGSYAYIELNAPLNSRDIGLFSYNNQLLIRKFIVRKDIIILRAASNAYTDIIISEKENFFIIGKILGTNNDF